MIFTRRMFLVFCWAPAVIAGAGVLLFLWTNQKFNDAQSTLADLREVTTLQNQRVDLLQAMVASINQQLPSMRSTWYGNYPKGRRTANGEVFNKRALTCAHRTLPFGTVLVLKHKDKMVAVRVNDRGPAAWTGHDIDVTERAAEILGFKRDGIATLTVWRLL
jgi:rare lipoprotein A (peptidoglycan hydrolase)